MANTGIKGVDVRQTSSKLVFRASLKDSAGAKLTTGTTSVYLYELQDDGTYKSYDFNDNTFKTTALTTETASATHRTGNNSTTNMGVWTYVLSTLTGFTKGAMYMVVFSNTGASSAQQEREFQFGSAEGDLVVTTGNRIESSLEEIDGDAQSMTDLKDFADAGYDPATNKVEGVKLADTLTTYTGNTPQTGDGYAVVNHVTYGLSALKTLIDDVPTVSEFNARTLLAASYATLAKQADIEADTQDIQTQLGTAGAGLTAIGDTRMANLDAAVSTRAAAATALSTAVWSAGRAAALDEVTVARMGALTDWIDGGRLDLILDAILTAAGTTLPAQITGLNNLSAAQVLTQVGNALATYDGPTKAELDAAVAGLALEATAQSIGTIVAAILVDTGTDIPALIAALEDISAAQVLAQVSSALATYDAPTKAELDAAVAPLALQATSVLVKAVTDNLATSMELDGAVYRFTTNALERAPGSTGALTVDQDALLTAIGARVAVLGSMAITRVSPLTISGTLEVVKGLAYTVANGFAPEWTSDQWPDLTDATVSLVDTDSAQTEIATGQVTAAGIGDQSVAINLTGTITADLVKGNRRVRVIAVPSGDTDPVPLAELTMIVEA